MPTRVHGHEVLHHLLDAPQPLTRDQLRAHVRSAFGEQATFHTCSAEGMDLDGLLAFLLERGKVSEVDGRLTAHRDQMCDHD